MLYVHRPKKPGLPIVGATAIAMGLAIAQLAGSNEVVPKSDPIELVAGFSFEHQENIELPTYGNRSAKHQVIFLSDYTCLHCRDLAKTLQALSQHYSDLKIVKYPATREGTEAEVIHRYMLAVWKVDPEKYALLERNLLNGRLAADARSVETEAMRLISTKRFVESVTENQAWISEQIALARAIQDKTREATGKGILPQLILGDEVLLGAHSDPNYYTSLFESKLAIAPANEELPDGPGIVLKNKVQNLGMVVPGEPVKFSVGFKNYGKKVEQLGWLNMGAGLSIESLDREEIEPGAEGVINLSLTLPKDTPPGTLERSVTVNTKRGQEQQTFRVIAAVGKNSQTG